MLNHAINRRLVVVSNRLPVAIQKSADQDWQVTRGSGGLVTALSPVLKALGGVWIGWAGCVDGDPERIAELLNERSREAGYRLLSVPLAPAEIESYYVGFCNEVLWMLFHDFNSLCKFEPEYWSAYQRINARFAEVTAQSSQDSDYVWVQDYHLLLVAQKLRELNVKRKIGLFLHTPFPPVDGFVKLPWRGEILQAMLCYDLIGFQTMRDMRNFLQCVHMLVPGVRLSDIRTLTDVKSLLYRVQALVPGARDTKVRATTAIRVAGHEVRIGAFPISIDYDDFVNRASREEISREVDRMAVVLPRTKLILGIDRLDYSKGIPLRLRAFKTLLQLHPELIGKVTLIQVVIPSRMDSNQYQNLKREIDRLVGDINGGHSEAGWTPVIYIFRPLSDPELLAFYRRSDIALVTPLKDGMNLIAKEYCACQLDDDGVLILSEFAGAAAQISRDAIVVNPFDIEGVAEAIYRAYQLPPAERRARMARMRAMVRQHNIFHWVDDFLNVAIPKKVTVFPLVEDFIPSLFVKHRTPDGQAQP